ncbi:extracellular solute-binding protein [Simkania negevensis]|uniref:Extracellular solute-binding protein family 1 n=1 Tax=Simkania negevensis (strain ATCC VR-1471 / DSM 27360 / Z) TaxID=331113 RepID=F8L7H4_SIMNZ|nr:extracellular solute-binding protein [Simkania negevensis]MCB1068547.1 extracellular solute-binding protein [Simkania sp.]MCB1075196.1 extracellular solute-binding protein [Simkania sp.]MCP5491182.1 extracellular solute-binding protein [Chlamydiales bacterium]CCB88707.1 extracellular solute-binding protein family 1 [Simkania negevensis Z]
MKRSTLYIRLTILTCWIALIFGALWMTTIHISPKTDENTLNVYGWPEMFLPEVIDEFEKETGIKVRLHYYTTNEEMLVTMKATEGQGYDLILPSDYAVSMLIKEGLIKPLDHSQLNFLDTLNPILLKHDYDPENRYAIPYQWEVFGFGIDSDYFQDKNLDPSWNTIFDPEDPELKLAMVNDPIEAVNFAAYYLNGAAPHLDEKKTRKVRDLLEKQKSWVEAYAGLRADYLLATKNCHVALCTSSYIFRSSTQYPHVKFTAPKEWTFISIENMSIPKASTKDAQVYEFLNFIYKAENLGRDTNTFFRFPATTNTTPFLEVPSEFLIFLENSHLFEGKLYFIRHLIPEKEIRKIWVDVKS